MIMPISWQIARLRQQAPLRNAGKRTRICGSQELEGKMYTFATQRLLGSVEPRGTRVVFFGNTCRTPWTSWKSLRLV
jgi:hypothetical protein